MLAWLWTRLSEGGARVAISGRALSRFPANDIERLLRAQVLIEEQKVDTWSVCAECDCGLDARPIRDFDGEIRACCPYDSAEDVILEADDLRRFRIDADRLAPLIAKSAGLAGNVARIGDGLWLLGQSSRGKCLFLCRDTEFLSTSGAILAVKSAAGAAPVTIIVNEIDPATGLRLRESGLEVLTFADCVRTEDVGSQRLAFESAPSANLTLRLQLNLQSRIAVLDGREITLAEQSFTLLRCLAEAACDGRPLVETRRLEDLIWGNGIHRVQSTIRDPVRSLRDALGKGAPDPGAIRSLIVSRRSPNGYQLVLAPSEIRLTE